MKKLTSLFVAFGIAAGLALAGDGDAPKEGCKACPSTAAQPTALAAARQALADAPKAEEKLTAEQRAELKSARDFLLQTGFGKSMGPSFEACGRLTLAASAQPGTSPEAAALLKDMGATYCSLAKVFGGCAECACCEGAKECHGACGKDMAPDAIAKKAKESLETARKLVAAAYAEKPTPEVMEKTQAAVATLSENCSMMPAIEKATVALSDAYASLAKMGIPSVDPKNAARDELVKGALELHGKMTECEECEECEECGEAEEVEETEAPTPDTSS